ncbi:SGNH/GDSL hydrolase family protein [Mucilaginibacter sp. RS28]|uniref:SGNH/GDSL hydrolase family protein n=1 Tax=Mucilaginibacter straminoryzae TaxID=2932774 RepID=A0A9X1X6Y9_9SPHI|nr:SGNH/GDSL hydrolase family protein [Mucilaginibacter straminoryzae]MCJ8211731.1 SGNH/GDSL hydrolase family protein [Mucilaginibacter straminoryzae]
MKIVYRLVLIVFIALSFYSCKKDSNNQQPDAVTQTYHNVLILGNSITYATADGNLGWKGNWGMAASAPEKDYVHLLTKSLQTLAADCKVQAFNISPFEFDYKNYNLDNLQTYRDLKPDLLILRIGENVQPTNFDAVAFEQKYTALLSYFKSTNPNLKILAVSSFWTGRDYVDQIMAKYPPYLSLAYLGTDLSNYALDMPNVDYAVQTHPGDKGMQAIADAIYKKATTIK